MAEMWGPDSPYGFLSANFEYKMYLALELCGGKRCRQAVLEVQHLAYLEDEDQVGEAILDRLLEEALDDPQVSDEQKDAVRRALSY